MAKQSVEEIKAASAALRGKIKETLSSDASHFEEAEYQLLKFHGTYQQDDRDQRIPRKKAGLDKAWMFMVRSKMPGGRLTAEQYLVHDRMADELGNGTIRISTRQGFQIHGVLKDGLKATIARIKSSGLTTWGACGDVVRNTMGPASPIADPAHRDAQKLAEEISQKFLARSRAYVEIWLNGEKLEDLEPASPREQEDPIYGETYLPRKFKIGIAIPPRNDVDVYSQDIGFVPHFPNGEVEGYTILVGGGFGMTHGMVKTHPTLAKPLFYVAREDAVEAAVAIVTTQRDFGNREDRKRARMKYLIEERGLDWFRKEVQSRLNAPTEEPKSVEWTTVSDMNGWNEQGDGKLFCCAWVEEGRIQDTEKTRWRTAFREIAEKFGSPVSLTPNCNLIFYDIDPSDREAIQAVLDAHGVPRPETLTETRKMGHACVALPTCGLALSESERVFPSVISSIEPILKELGLEQDQLLIRMTGCPNGCARPYNADIAFVGRAPGKYALFIGGSSTGDRLAGLEKKVVKEEEIPDAVRPYLEEYAANRRNGETFSQYWGRTHTNGPEPDPEQFHIELEERAQRLAEKKA